MKSFVAAIIALLVCNMPVSAQTGIPTPEPEAEHPAPGALGQGAEVQVSAGVSIDVPGRACQRAIYKALEAHAPVAVSDPECAEDMKKALALQRQNPEPTDSPTPEAVDTPSIE